MRKRDFLTPIYIFPPRTPLLRNNTYIRKEAELLTLQGEPCLSNLEILSGDGHYYYSTLVNPLGMKNVLQFLHRICITSTTLPVRGGTLCQTRRLLATWELPHSGHVSLTVIFTSPWRIGIILPDDTGALF